MELVDQDSNSRSVLQIFQIMRRIKTTGSGERQPNKAGVKRSCVLCSAEARYLKGYKSVEHLGAGRVA